MIAADIRRTMIASARLNPASFLILRRISFNCIFVARFGAVGSVFLEAITGFSSKYLLPLFI
jgi:hypothetical protein